MDDRIVKVSIEIKDKLKIYEGLAISASGTKYSNSLQNECEVRIANMDAETRNYILTEATPFNKNKKRKKIIVEAGRVSYGVSKIFSGNIIAATVSQPPDITLVLKCLTSNYSKGVLVSRNQAPKGSLRTLAKQVAVDTLTTLDFQASEKTIGNYTYSGSALKQVDKLNQMGDVDAFIDDDILYVKDRDKSLKNKLKLINLNTGMIGLPEATEYGVKVKFLLDNNTFIGGALELRSQLNPALNGIYTIYKLNFEISNRDQNFYYIAEARRRYGL